MVSTKLVQVLKKFTKKEFRGLKKFLNIPDSKEFLKMKKSIALFKIIYPYYPDFKASKLQKETVFKKLYPGETYKIGKIEKQISSLLELVQEFIVLQAAGKRKELDRLLILTTFYRNRDLHNLAEISNKRYLKMIQKSDYKNSAYYYDIFLLEKQNARYQKLYPINQENHL